MNMFDNCWNTDDGSFFKPSTGCMAIIVLAATTIFCFAYGYIRYKDESRLYKDERGNYKRTFMRDVQDNYMSLVPLYIICLLAAFPVVQFFSLRMNKNTAGKRPEANGENERYLETSW
jgi:hypothetical protein